MARSRVTQLRKFKTCRYVSLKPPSDDRSIFSI